MTLAPGIHALGERDYHTDSVSDVPSLSASIAHILVSQSPRHAWTRHPRLNPQWQPEHDDKFDRGKAAHRVLLEGHEDGLVVVDEDSWRKAEAQNTRDLARERGAIPLLRHQLDGVCEMVDAAKAQLREHSADPPLFTDGRPEVCAVWEDRGVVCRALIDWLHDDLSTIDDLKTVGRSAEAGAYSRALYSTGGDIQAAMNVRAVELLTGVRPRFRWVAVEAQPPYALSVIEAGPDVLMLGRKKMEYALDAWRRCLERDEFPAYPPVVTIAELPVFEEQRWLEREEREAA